MAGCVHVPEGHAVFMMSMIDCDTSLVAVAPEDNDIFMEPMAAVMLSPKA